MKMELPCRPSLMAQSWLANIIALPMILKSLKKTLKLWQPSKSYSSRLKKRVMFT
jgi:hypothetical protein